MTTEPSAALPTAAYKLMILAGLLATFSVALGAAAWSYEKKTLTERTGVAKPLGSGRAATPVATRPAAAVRPTRVRTRSS